MLTKILIANRGEIACRVIRTANRMGIKTVAVYSDADAQSLHVEMADEAVHIGASSAAESYLDIRKIIDAAKRSGAEAIHPGYGFLSENPKFVKAVEAAGLVFIGPSEKAIRAMGLKDAAKKLMEKSGVPVVPGYHGKNQDAAFLAAEAKKIGYPVLIKARAGGGGKGMRRVDAPREFKAALEGARREGEAGFGDGHVLIEKYITAPRHIEIQVFGDQHGNVVHLFERDCSLQRRHQKVIEEAPAPGMGEKMRNTMGDAAVKAAQAIGYCGAGTVEFIVDGSKGLKPDRFWFMEMNTRLQVEHPVTEAITGLDLVEWQLRVADGEPLPKSQNQLAISGHAIEARLYAEDVPKGFLPATGRLDHLVFCADARNDTGVRPGDVITPFYDPMIAKVIVHGKTRVDALSKIGRALDATQIAGTVTNIAFLSALVRHGDFIKGRFETGLIARDLEALTAIENTPFEMIALAAIAASGAPSSARSADPFDLLKHHVHWRGTPFSVHLGHQGEDYHLKLLAENDGGWTVGQGEQSCRFFDLSMAADSIHYTVSGHHQAVCYHHGATNLVLFTHPGIEFLIPDPLSQDASSQTGNDGLTAPMSGMVKQVQVKAGKKVRAGDPLVVLEAMKMEHTLCAPRDGVVEAVFVRAGDQVNEGTELAKLEHEA